MRGHCWQARSSFSASSFGSLDRRGRGGRPCSGVYYCRRGSCRGPWPAERIRAGEGRLWTGRCNGSGLAWPLLELRPSLLPLPLLPCRGRAEPDLCLPEGSWASAELAQLRWPAPTLGKVEREGQQDQPRPSTPCWPRSSSRPLGFRSLQEDGFGCFCF